MWARRWQQRQQQQQQQQWPSRSTFRFLLLRHTLLPVSSVDQAPIRCRGVTTLTTMTVVKKAGSGSYKSADGGQSNTTQRRLLLMTMVGLALFATTTTATMMIFTRTATPTYCERIHHKPKRNTANDTERTSSKDHDESRNKEEEEDEEEERMVTPTVGHYENRLRNFSHPLKVFHYFASMRRGMSYWMTPSDLLTSLLPYQEALTQPVAFTPAERARRRAVVQEVTDFFKLADTDGDGLINFAEYCFFLTLLATPAHHIDITFRLFDEDESGRVTQREFAKAMACHAGVIQHRFGTKEWMPAFVNLDATAHDPTSSPTSSSSSSSSSSSPKLHGLAKHFFGEDGDQSLTIGAFRSFLETFRSKLLKLEFYAYPVDAEGKIELRDFAQSVIRHANLKRWQHYADKLKQEQLQQQQDLQLQQKEGSKQKREVPFSGSPDEKVSFEQFEAFDHFIQRIKYVGLSMRLMATTNEGQSGLTFDQFCRVARLSTAASSSSSAFAFAEPRLTDAHPLSNAQLRVLFDLFDTKEDGMLDEEEFLSVLRKRRSYGMHLSTSAASNGRGPADRASSTRSFQKWVRSLKTWLFASTQRQRSSSDDED